MKTRTLALLAAAAFALTWAVAGEAAPAVKPAELIALLKSKAPNNEKVKAFKPLAIFGGKDAVPAIAPYLADPELSSWARIALEAIPDPSCDDALRTAEATLKGRLLIGVINSIGVRRDAQAVPALVKRLGDADEAVAIAAAAALGRIGGDAAEAALEKTLAHASPAIRDEAADAVVRCAEKELAARHKEAAIRLCDLVVKADLPERRVLEGIHGAIVARGAAGVPMLAELLKSTDRKRFALGLKLCREVSAPEVTDALLADLSAASAARKPLLLLALADRADPKARDALLQAAKSGTGAMRIASLRGLKKAGDASCAAVLLDAAVADDVNVSNAAADALADLPGKEIDDMLVARLPLATGAGRLALIDLAGRRHIESATPILLKLADNADAGVREAALMALGATIPANDLPVLITRVVESGKPAEVQAALSALRAACARMADRDAPTAQVAAALAKAPPPVRCKLIGVFVAIGGDKALKIVADAAKDSNGDIRRAGYKALGEWTSADAGPVLLNLLKNGDADLKGGALRAYIRVARQFVIPADKRMAMFREIMALAQRDEERRLALGILKQIRTPESLALAVGYLDQPSLNEEAARVVLAMSDKMVDTPDKNEVRAAMQKVVEKAKNKDLVDKARALWGRAGNK